MASCLHQCAAAFPISNESGERPAPARLAQRYLHEGCRRKNVLSCHALGEFEYFCRQPQHLQIVKLILVTGEFLNHSVVNKLAASEQDPASSSPGLASVRASSPATYMPCSSDSIEANFTQG